MITKLILQPKPKLTGEDIQLLDFDGETMYLKPPWSMGKMTSITINRPDILPKRSLCCLWIGV